MGIKRDRSWDRHWTKRAEVFEHRHNRVKQRRPCRIKHCDNMVHFQLPTALCRKHWKFMPKYIKDKLFASRPATDEWVRYLKMGVAIVTYRDRPLRERLFSQQDNGRFQDVTDKEKRKKTI